MYGDLQGLDKGASRARWGEDQVHIWRRSYDVPPPNGESLAMTAERTVPYLEEVLLPALDVGRSLLVVAHGNSLRSLIMRIRGLSEEEVIGLSSRRGSPSGSNESKALGARHRPWVGDVRVMDGWRFDGSPGRLLDVDLSTGSLRIERLSADLIRSTLGGKALATDLLVHGDTTDLDAAYSHVHPVSGDPDPARIQRHRSFSPRVPSKDLLWDPLVERSSQRGPRSPTSSSTPTSEGIGGTTSAAQASMRFESMVHRRAGFGSTSMTRRCVSWTPHHWWGPRHGSRNNGSLRSKVRT